MKKSEMTQLLSTHLANQFDASTYFGADWDYEARLILTILEGYGMLPPRYTQHTSDTDAWGREVNEWETEE